MKEEKVYYGENLVYISFISKEDFLQINEQPNTVHAFPLKDGKILATVNQRGVDIIGGHIEGNERPEEALFREAMEEGYIKPLKYEIIGAIKVDNRDSHTPKSKYPKVGYQLFYVITEYETLPFKAEFESTDRLLLTKEEFAKKHHNWLGTQQSLIDIAATFIKEKKKSTLKI